MASKIAEFARDILGIEVSEAQERLIDAIANGNYPIGANSVPGRIASEYLKHGLKDLEFPKPATNAHGQPIGDFPDDVPTKAEFDKIHAEPRGYGDEDDWLLVSKAVDKHKAFEMIVETMKEWGSDNLPKDEIDLSTFDIGWGYDHDSFHYSEGNYWICDEKNHVSKRWEAWGWATQ